MNVRALREAKKLSQAELARASGVSRQIICMVESGYRPASVLTAQKLAAALGIAWSDFFEKEAANGSG